MVELLRAATHRVRSRERPHVRRKRDIGSRVHLRHLLEPRTGVLEVLHDVAEGGRHPDARLNRPDPVGVEPDRAVGKRLVQRAGGRDLLLRLEDDREDAPWTVMGD